MVIISLSIIVGSIEIVVLSASVSEVVSTAFVISTEDVVTYVIGGSVEIVVFSGSVEVIASVVLISSVKVSVVK